MGKEEPKTAEGTRPKMKRMKEAGFKKLAGNTVTAMTSVSPEREASLKSHDQVSSFPLVPKLNLNNERPTEMSYRSI